MAKVIFICDGCGKQEEGSFSRSGDALKPRLWYQRSDDEGVQLACSRRCIKRVAEKTGKTSLVLPI